MISLNRIERLVCAGAWERIIDCVLDNGRSRNLALRLRLARAEAACPAALGLALQRCCELTYGPTPAAAGLAARLIHAQNDRGLWRPADAGGGGSPGGASPGSLPAAAAALRGLIEYRRQRLEAAATVDPALETAIDRGLHALAGHQGEDGLIGDDGVDAAIVLWQLGGVAAFRERVRYFDLLEAVDASEIDVPEDVRRLAHAVAA